MNAKDARKRSSDCDNNVYQTNSFKRRRLEGSSIDALEVKTYNLAKLPSDCLRRILSFMTYEKVSHMRQVCTLFNQVGKKQLDKGQRELKIRLQRKIETAKKLTLHPTNLMFSYDTLCFLNDLHKSINNCTELYSYFVNFFVAGKLLDEASCLLKNFNSWTVVPYFQEHVYDQKPHPLLGPITALSERAYRHFQTKILHYFINRDEESDSEGDEQGESDLETQFERDEITKKKSKVLKKRKQRIDRGNQMSKKLLKLILKLNEDVLHFTLLAKEVDEEVERVINGIDHVWILPINKDRSRNFHLPLKYTSTKVMAIPGAKRPINLATLPSSCLRNIVSHLDCVKIAHLRIVCKSFNKACKKELSREFEKLKRTLELKIESIESFSMHELETQMMKDLLSILQLCKDKYKRHLGSNNYYFSAGKVLDEAKRVYNDRLPFNDLYEDDDVDVYADNYLNYGYKCRPHYSLFRLIDLVCEAIAHFKFNIAPKYFPSAQNPINVSDFLMTGDVINFEEEIQLNLEEIEKMIEEADAKIEEQNYRNRTYLKIISELKKKAFILNNEIFKNIECIEMAAQ